MWMSPEPSSARRQAVDTEWTLTSKSAAGVTAGLVPAAPLVSPGGVARACMRAAAKGAALPP